MDKADRRKLRKNRCFLVDNLEPKKILNRLIELEVFTPDMTEEIIDKTTHGDQVGKLLNMLELRGCAAYGNFRQTLQENGYEYLVEKLDATQINSADEVDGKPKGELAIKTTLLGKKDEGRREAQHVTNNVTGDNNIAIFCGNDTKINQYFKY